MIVVADTSPINYLILIEEIDILTWGHWAYCGKLLPLDY